MQLLDLSAAEGGIQIMTGMELAKAYYETYGKQMLEEEVPKYVNRIAVGLAGEGSECFGFDDAISRDHDFGPSFCMWLTKEDYQVISEDLRRAYNMLPKDFYGYPPRKEEPYGGERVGVLCIDDFFCRQIGRGDAEFTLMGWLSLPETRLATVTNGQVFTDPLGQFTAIREKLLAFYPEDVRLKKMAARAAIMGQAGQYNYARCMRRGETVAAQYALSQFVINTISMVFLLNRRYMPYYKWMHRGMLTLPLLGEEVGGLLKELVENGVSMNAWEGLEISSEPQALNSADRNVLLIEQICRLIADELRRESLSSETNSFLTHHGISIMSRIRDPKIRSLHLMEG